MGGHAQAVVHSTARAEAMEQMEDVGRFPFAALARRVALVRWAVALPLLAAVAVMVAVGCRENGDINGNNGGNNSGNAGNTSGPSGHGGHGGHGGNPTGLPNLLSAELVAAMALLVVIVVAPLGDVAWGRWRFHALVQRMFDRTLKVSRLDGLERLAAMSTIVFVGGDSLQHAPRFVDAVPLQCSWRSPVLATMRDQAVLVAAALACPPMGGAMGGAMGGGGADDGLDSGSGGSGGSGGNGGGRHGSRTRTRSSSSTPHQESVLVINPLDKAIMDAAVLVRDDAVDFDGSSSSTSAPTTTSNPVPASASTSASASASTGRSHRPSRSSSSSSGGRSSGGRSGSAAAVASFDIVESSDSGGAAGQSTAWTVVRHRITGHVTVRYIL
jgi:hypothetical protein